MHFGRIGLSHSGKLCGLSLSQCCGLFEEIRYVQGPLMIGFASEHPLRELESMSSFIIQPRAK